LLLDRLDPNSRILETPFKVLLVAVLVAFLRVNGLLLLGRGGVGTLTSMQLLEWSSVAFECLSLMMFFYERIRNGTNKLLILVGWKDHLDRTVLYAWLL
jgi:hypothetical protein